MKKGNLECNVVYNHSPITTLTKFVGENVSTYRKFKIQSGFIAFLFIGLLIINHYYPVPIIISIGAPLLAVLLFLRFFRALQQEFKTRQSTGFRQLEALSGLYHCLNIKQPIPVTRGTAASPDFLHLLTSLIFTHKPRVIVEVGSGISTVIAGYGLQKLNQGRLISLDHLEQYARQTASYVSDHGLSSVAEVFHAPLVSHNLGGKEYRWYDLTPLQEIDHIDLLIVDGPPKDINDNARYPAIPLLIDKLDDQSIIVLDDGSRSSETSTVKMWQNEFGFEASYHELEKGAYTCQKKT